MRCVSRPYNPCPSTPNAQCVIYTGPNLTNINVTTNDRLDVILQEINNSLDDLDFTLYTEDTVTLDLSGSGTEQDPLYGDVNVSAAFRNAIIINEDGLYVPSIIEAGVIYGGIVTWLDNYNYHVSAAGYYINGQFYESPEAYITLSSPDETYNRIDTFIVDTSGAVSVLEGTPSDNPAQAALDPATQLQLSLALVETGTTEPTIDQECLYNDNDGTWTTFSSNSTRLNPDSTTNPCNGTKSIESTSPATNNDYITFTRPTAFNPANLHSLLTFYIRSKITWTGSQTYLRFQWYNAGVAVGSPVQLRHNTYGFLSSNISTCQIVSIPLRDFGLLTSTEVDALRITVSRPSGNIGVYLDDICIQGQALPEIPNPLDEKVKISSNDTTAGYLLEKLTAGSGITLTENNNGGNETITIAVASATLTANNALTMSTPSNVQLGGTLIQNTSITSSDPSYRLTITGVNTFAEGAMLDVITSGTVGIAVRGETTNGRGILGIESGNGAAVMGASHGGGYALFGDAISTGGGLYVSALEGLPAEFIAQPASTDTVIPVAKFSRITSGTALDGIGQSLDFYLYTDAYFQQLSNQIISKYTDVTDATRTSQFIITGVGSGTTSDLVTLNGDGSAQLNHYGDGNFTGSETYILGVDADGNVIEVDASGVGATVTADNGLIMSTATNVQLGNSNGTFEGAFGAPLLHETYINSAGYGLTISGNKSYSLESHNAVLTVINRSTTLVDQAEGLYVKTNSQNSTGIAVNSQGVGITVESSSLGVYASSSGSSSQAISASATGNNSVAFQGVASGTGTGTRILSGIIYGANENDVKAAVTLSRFTSSVNPPDDGIGQSIEFDIATGPSSSVATANSIVSLWTDAAFATRTSQMVFTGVDSTVTSDLLALNGNGSILAPHYGSGNFTGTATYILAVDSSGNIIEESVGSLGGITANNGLTENVANNIQLGGTLNQTTTILSGGFELSLQGANDNNSILEIINTGTTNPNGISSVVANGIGLIGTSTSSSGIQGVSTSGTGIVAQSTSGTGLSVTSISGTALVAITNPSSTNTVATMAVFRRTSTGTPAAGMGASLQFELETPSITSNLSNTIVSKWTDATHVTRTSQLVLTGVNSGTAVDILTLNGNKSIKANGYGTGVFTGTPTYTLAVDADGDIIEVAGGTGITANNGITMSTATNAQLGGVLTQDTTVGDITQNFGITFSRIGTGAATTLSAVSNTGVALNSASTSGNALISTSTSGLAGVFTINPSSTNTLDEVIRVARTSSGTPANGLGGSINFTNEVSDNSQQLSARIGSTFTDVTLGTRTGDLQFWTTDSATTAIKGTLAGSGALRLHTYGTGARTAGAATYSLSVDANGNVIETAIGSGMTNPMSAVGDLITSSDGAGTPVRIAAGTSGYVLTSNGPGTQPTWQVAGGGGSGITRTVSTISSPTTAGSAVMTDYVYLVSGTTTITLPTAVGNTNTYTIIRTDVSLVTTIATTSSQTINGALTATLDSQYESVTLVSNGSNWFEI